MWAMFNVLGVKKTANKVQCFECIHYLWFSKLSNRHLRLLWILAQGFPLKVLKRWYVHLYPLQKIKEFLFCEKFPVKNGVWKVFRGRVIIHNLLIKGKDGGDLFIIHQKNQIITLHWSWLGLKVNTERQSWNKLLSIGNYQQAIKR